MKKYLVAIFVSIMMFGISAKAMAAAAASDVVCNGCVGTTDIANSAVIEAKVGTSAVTNTKIADGAVTSAKITGPIAASKIEKPANVITVATSGGDFTSISAALASLPDPNTTPTVIKVMPGTYTESNGIQMKSNVHLQGSGREVTTVDLSSGLYKQINLSNLNNVEISGLSIINFYDGILSRGSQSVTISNNAIKAIGNYCGILVEQEGSVVITANILTDSRYGVCLHYQSGTTMVSNNVIKGNQYGIYDDSGDTNATISGNVISDNTISGIETNAYASSVIGNTIYNNPVGINIGTYSSYNGLSIIGNTIRNSTEYGIKMTRGTNTKISNNQILGSGLSDIYKIITGGSANISLNVYDTYMGYSDNVVGAYNVKSDGTPAPLQ